MSYLYIGIVLGILGVLSLSGVIFLFFVKRTMLKKENHLKEKFNEFAIIDIDKKIYPIYEIGFSSPKYENLSSFFTDFRAKYESTIFDLKKKMLSLISANEYYDWKSFNQIYQSIDNDLNNLSKSLEEANNLIFEVFDYNVFMSELVVECRENSKKVIDFYESNLSFNYDSHKISSLISVLKETNEQMNEFLIPSEPATIMETIDEHNKNLLEFTALIENIYVADKEKRYIDYSINEINDFVNHKSRMMHSSNHNNAQKNLMKVNSNLASLQTKIKNFEFESVSSKTNWIIKELLKIKESLHLDFTSSEFFSENKNLLLETISVFKSSYRKMNLALIKLKENFVIDKVFVEEINREILRLVWLNDNLVKVEAQITSHFIPSELITIAKGCITQIMYWVNSCEAVVNNASLKYKHYINTINEITSNKLLIAQILIFINKNNIAESRYLEEIALLKGRLSKIEKDIFKNYSIKAEYNYHLLTDVKQEIYLLSQDFVKVFIAKKYIEKMVWYINLMSVAKTKKPISTKTLLALYSKGQYQKGISEAIKLLKNF